MDTGRDLKLWLDDLRRAPPGWTHVHTVAAAKELLARGDVVEASLDHDLGLGPATCPDCLARGEAGTVPIMMECTCSCHEQETGYALCVWMARERVWPKTRPIVHSANVVGAERMRGVIERYFPSAAEQDEVP